MGLLFITFGFVDLIDILLVAIILYQLYKLVRGTVAMNIFVGLLLLVKPWRKEGRLGRLSGLIIFAAYAAYAWSLF